jgi:hypothetical protein
MLPDRTPSLVAAVMIVALLLSTGCARRSGARPSSSATAGIGGSETVWHLRSALNVAALSCRGNGRTPVAGAYRTFLNRHSALLSRSYAIEQERHGHRALDSHLTQLYNRFANQRAPAKFCSASAAIAKRANSESSAVLSNSASGHVSELERALR